LLFARLLAGRFFRFHFFSAGLEQEGFNRDNSSNPLQLVYSRELPGEIP
jgi:hypothetical protein